MPGSPKPASQRSSIIVFARQGEARVEHLKPVSFESAGIREVQDLQKWILDKPEVLGEPLLILDDQFSEFERSRDRLDILCLDQQRHVVVVELKRTESASYADLQSLRYAAMVRTFTFDMAAHYLSISRLGKERGLDEDKSKKEILDFIEHEEEEGPPELEREPRIIIASPGFSDELLTTVHYLKEHEIDVTCISLSAYSVGEGHFVLVPDVEYPPRGIEEHLVKIRKKEEARLLADRTRAEGALRSLFDQRKIKGGETLLLKHNLPDYVKFREADPVFRAAVEIQDGVPKIRWEKDGNLYSPSKVAVKLFREFYSMDHSDSSTLPGWQGGSRHWGTENESLRAWADRVRATEPE